jgi:hypothetical protein
MNANLNKLNSWGRLLSQPFVVPLTSQLYCHVWGVCVTNSNGFWIGWLNLLPLLYDHDQWLSKTSSIPYWTTSVFSSSVTAYNDDGPTNSLTNPLIDEWTLFYNKERTDERSPPRTVLVILFFHCHETCLPNRCPAMDYFVSIRCSGNLYLASL